MRSFRTVWPSWRDGLPGQCRPASPRPKATLPAARPVAAPGDPAPTPARQRSANFEDLLGGRILALIGALAVVLAGAFFFALAISNGWIDEAGAHRARRDRASVALFGLGVWLHERKGRTYASLSITGAALACLFLTVTVAAEVYDLIPASAALALAMLVGACGPRSPCAGRLRRSAPSGSSAHSFPRYSRARPRPGRRSGCCSWPTPRRSACCSGSAGTGSASPAFSSQAHNGSAGSSSPAPRRARCSRCSASVRWGRSGDRFRAASSGRSSEPVLGLPARAERAHAGGSRMARVHRHSGRAGASPRRWLCLLWPSRTSESER